MQRTNIYSFLQHFRTKIEIDTILKIDNLPNIEGVKSLQSFIGVSQTTFLLGQRRVAEYVAGDNRLFVGEVLPLNRLANQEHVYK